MKIRISPNQLRIRLSHEDLQELNENGFKVESIHFSALETFEYELSVWNLDIMEATFHSSKMKISIPQSSVESLKNTDLMTIETSQKNGAGEDLRIIVEKDLNAFRRG